MKIFYVLVILLVTIEEVHLNGRQYVKIARNSCLKVHAIYIFNSETSKYAQSQTPVVRTWMWKAAQDFKECPGALVMSGQPEKPSSGHRRYSRFCRLTAKWKAGGPFHYWFIFNGRESWAGASYMATFTIKWLCSVWILMWLHVNTCIKYSGLEKHLGLLAGCWRIILFEDT